MKKNTLYNNYICDYSNNVKRSHLIKNLKKIYLRENINFTKEKFFFIVGRVLRKRIMGRVTFLKIEDFTECIQLYVSSNNFKNIYKKIISYLKLGDIINVKGNLFKTKTGEISLNVINLKILSKNLNTFPDKQSGLINIENCYRKRYLDLMVNKSTKKLFIKRFNIINKIRNFFLKHNFLEVETPIMQSFAGGADAKPFETYHNYLRKDVYLRISPELYLKRLIVGGFEKIFEIGKNFRNEGLSIKHHQEFTMLEFYEAFSNYKKLMKFTEKLLKYLVKFLFNDTKFNYDSYTLNFSKKFYRLDYYDLLMKKTKLSLEEINNKKILLKRKIL